MKTPTAATVWMCIFGLAGLVLTLKVFRGIVSGEMGLMLWTFKRDGRERWYWTWMACFAMISLAFYFAALRFYLGAMRF